MAVLFLGGYALARRIPALAPFALEPWVEAALDNLLREWLQGLQIPLLVGDLEAKESAVAQDPARFSEGSKVILITEVSEAVAQYQDGTKGAIGEIELPHVAGDKRWIPAAVAT